MKRRFRLAGVSVAVALGALVAATLPSVPAGAAGPKGSISGTVTSSAGTSLAHAVVNVWTAVGGFAGCGDQLSGPAGWKLAATATTDGAGRYAVARLASGMYRVEVVPSDLDQDAHGYWIDSSATPNVTPWITLATNVNVAGKSAQTVDVRLAEPATITGVVTDKDSGLPLTGIEVRAVRASPPSDGVGGYQWMPDYTSAVTNASGAYTLAGLPRSAASQNDLYYGLVLIDPAGTHQDYIWWQDPLLQTQPPSIWYASLDANTAISATHDVALTPSAAVTVTLTKGRGHPLEGMKVEYTTMFPAPYRLTDGNGVVTLPALSGQPGSIYIYVSDPGGAYHPAYYASGSSVGSPNAVGATAPDADTALTVAMTMERGVVVNGHLSQGTPPSPVQNGFVAAYLASDPMSGDIWQYSVGTYGGLSTDCNGAFTLTVWPQHSYKLYAVDQGSQLPTNQLATFTVRGQPSIRLNVSA